MDASPGAYTVPLLQGGMDMKRFLTALCAAMMLTVSAGALEVSAPSAVLMEKETGTVL